MTSGGGTRAYEKLSLPLFLLGYFCALSQVPLGLHGTGFGPGFEGVNIAKSRVSSGKFSDPIGSPTGPTAHAGPVVPFVIAFFMTICKWPVLVVAALMVLNACLLGLVMALLPELSEQVYGSYRPGVFGAVLMAVCSRLVAQGEGALSAALALAATLSILSAGPVKSGFWVGVSVLTNPLPLLMLAVIAMRRGWRFWLICSAVGFALCAPWIARNVVMLGAPYPIRDNFGLELDLSNFDGAEPELVTNSPVARTTQAASSRDEAALVASLGEGVYNRLRLLNALRWVRSHPRRFLELSAERTFYYWLPSPREGWEAYGYWLLTILGSVGAWLARKNRTAMLLALGLVAYSLPLVVIQTDVRYRFPTLWISALLAGGTLQAGVELLSRRKAAPHSHEPRIFSKDL